MDSTKAFASTFQGNFKTPAGFPVHWGFLGAFGSMFRASSVLVFSSNIPWIENAGKRLSAEILGGWAVITNARIPVILTVILPGQYKKLKQCKI